MIRPPPCSTHAATLFPYPKLFRSDETYSTALAELVNTQFRHPFACHWGDGTTSSSDGQNFRTGSKAKSIGHINPKYGSSPGRTFYTHISDQYAPFHAKIGRAHV